MNYENTPPEAPTPISDAEANKKAFQTLIPTENKPALIGYYLGVFGLLPFIGIPLAIAAIIFGRLGLKQFKQNPTPGAKGHAITAIVLGTIGTTCFVLFFAAMFLLRIS